MKDIENIKLCVQLYFILWSLKYTAINCCTVLESCAPRRLNRMPVMNLNLLDASVVVGCVVVGCAQLRFATPGSINTAGNVNFYICWFLVFCLNIALHCSDEISTLILRKSLEKTIASDAHLYLTSWSSLNEQGNLFFEVISLHKNILTNIQHLTTSTYTILQITLHIIY